ncbi:hypothetical protein [Roseateles oligotrophus]|uniref:Uncharacterized protein n=1 Tax=Roseateles oligotrophus TaxID=1769250 RepID=A0ABT2YMK0_9BURK|nr:hypothetical protein [Roseateles oligotrophus]MCV2371299.1 hypothetical protein [Roseateles oligotrophus]
MIRNQRLRRVCVAVLFTVAVLLMLFSPPVKGGLLVFALGVLLELAGLALQWWSDRQEPQPGRK